MAKKSEKRTKVLAFAVILSIVLYFAGVMSGLYANKVLERKTAENIDIFRQETRMDFGKLKEETQNELFALQNYTVFLEENLRTMQLEQLFLETLNASDMCVFSDISLSKRFSQLAYFWERLPFRMEEYEANTPLSEEYLLLKKQYTDLSLRTWILAKGMYQRCNTSLVQGIYFYSADCADCISQGEELDFLKAQLVHEGFEPLIFTLDIDFPDPVIILLRTYFGIDNPPALIINNRVYHGRIFTSREIMQELRGVVQ